ncbi:hypothetical protein K474DRAFT_1713432 [Panus rudis PR-1116 ss-1]|nr:hypothetical protein K474DRAFT_1713432 [Panus rudis PR-1116 ss-1]
MSKLTLAPDLGYTGPWLHRSDLDVLVRVRPKLEHVLQVSGFVRTSMWLRHNIFQAAVIAIFAACALPSFSIVKPPPPSSCTGHLPCPASLSPQKAAH